MCSNEKKVNIHMERRISQQEYSFGSLLACYRCFLLCRFLSPLNRLIFFLFNLLCSLLCACLPALLLLLWIFRIHFPLFQYLLCIFAIIIILTCHLENAKINILIFNLPLNLINFFKLTEFDKV